MNEDKICHLCNRFGINKKGLDNWYSCDDKDWNTCQNCNKGICLYCYEMNSGFFDCDKCKQCFCWDCSNDNRDDYDTYCDACIRKYNIKIEIIDYEHEMRKNRLEYREFELKIGLKKKGLKFRAGSKLCNSYITTGEPDINYIIRRIGELKFLHEYCDFKNILENKKNTLFCLSPFDKTERKILERIKEYPKHFPWEQDMAIRKIQKACYNWLWKPKTDDGKIGINLRLGLRDLDNKVL